LKFLKSTLVLFVLSISHQCLAQDSTAFFILTQEDIRNNNITNLEEALKLPAFHQYYFKNVSTTSSGILSMSNIAIYKDDRPLLLDQNTGYDLRAIPTWDIDRIEVHFAPTSTIVKNSSAIVVKLISVPIIEEPFSLSATIANTSASDFHISTQVSLSNKVHTGKIGLNRSFETAFYADPEDRGTAISALERYDLNFIYKYKILRIVDLTIGGDNSVLKTQNRGELIDGTTRVRDINQDLRKHALFGTISSALSKNHTLSLNGLIHRYKNDLITLDKDLSNAKEQQFNGPSSIFSTSYDQGYMQLLLVAKNQILNYTIGLEINNIKDNQFPSIKAIASEYSDYSVLGLFEYQLKNSFKLEGGTKILTNSLTGTYFMPQAKLTLAPNKDLQFVGSFHKSISYPRFGDIFYPSEMRDGIENSLLLKPTDINTFNFKVVVQKKNIRLQSGILFIDQTKTPQPTRFNTIENSGESRSTSTYASLVLGNKIWNIRPSIIIHGTNYLRDTSRLTFFYPEANIYAQLQVPQTKLSFNTSSRFVGSRTYSYFYEGVIHIEEQEKFNNVSLSVSYLFNRNRLKIYFGINNLRNVNFIASNTYQLYDIDREQIGERRITANKNRSFFFKASFQL